MREIEIETTCPICGEKVKGIIWMGYDRCWVSVDPKEGLYVYGGYSSDKGAYCEWKSKTGFWGLHLGDKLILRSGHDGRLPILPDGKLPLMAR